MNKFVNWVAMRVGYERPTNDVVGTQVGFKTAPNWLRVKWGGADNADHYAGALAYGAHAVSNNCVVHLLVRNIAHRGATLFQAFGAVSPGAVRQSVFRLITLLRDMPSLVSSGPIAADAENRNDTMFQVGMELLLNDLRVNGWENGAAKLGTSTGEHFGKCAGACYFLVSSPATTTVQSL